ncbi:hypothetical protein THIOKS12350046 [Thiocapsa sp. KS1]|nr:hypothetical protein THIOKS12350046 [Thiocapsa sp. KS1]
MFILFSESIYVMGSKRGCDIAIHGSHYISK